MCSTVDVTSDQTVEIVLFTCPVYHLDKVLSTPYSGKHVQICRVIMLKGCRHNMKMGSLDHRGLSTYGPLNSYHQTNVNNTVTEGGFLISYENGVHREGE